MLEKGKTYRIKSLGKLLLEFPPSVTHGFPSMRFGFTNGMIKCCGTVVTAISKGLVKENEYYWSLDAMEPVITTKDYMKYLKKLQNAKI